MRSEILEINEVNEKECSVVYKILNKPKNVVYKKNSKKLLSCINNYLDDLSSKKKKIKNKDSNQLLSKQILMYILVALIDLVIIYFVLNYCFIDNKMINTIIYIGCLLLITLSFLLVNLINYKSNIMLINEANKLEKEIKIISSLKDNCILYKKSI